MAQSPIPASTPDWRNVISQVEQAVAASLAALNRRERAAQAEMAPSPALMPHLDEVRKKIVGLDEWADRAGGVIRDVDGALAEREEVMRQSVEELRRLTTTLADLPKPG